MVFGSFPSRIAALFLRLQAHFHPREEFTNKAPYGKCNTAPDALDWISDGTVTQTCVDHDGFERCWYTYTPDSVSSTTNGVPAVIHLHGAGGCASLPALGLGTLAQEEGFIVVWPQGLSFLIPFIPSFLPNFLMCLFGFEPAPSWNDGTGLFGAEANGIDDMGFLNMVVLQVLEDPLVDPTRLYLSGHSNGATMAQRFALQSESLVAGVVAVSGAAMPNDELWSGSYVLPDYSPTPIIFVSGTLDRVIPFSDRRGPYAGAIPSWQGWASVNGCTDNPPMVTEYESYINHTYTECDNGAQVHLLEIENAGHHPFTKGEEPFLISPLKAIADCPFRSFPFLYEPDCRFDDLDTTRLAWDFVKGFQLEQ